MKYLLGLLVALLGLCTALSASAQLNLAWGRTFSWNGLQQDAGQAAAWSPQGDLYVVGYHYPRDGVYLEVVKYNSAGIYRWRRSFPSQPFLTGDQSPQIGVDSAGNLIVAAQNLNADSTWMTVRKFAPDGAVLWYRNVFGPHGYVVPAQLVVDSHDNVCVAATALAGPQSDYIYNGLTIKYNAAGVQQWAATYDGPAVNASVAGMAVDASGDVFDLVNVQNAADPVRIVSYSRNGVRQGVTVVHVRTGGFYGGQAIVASANRLLVLLLSHSVPTSSAVASYTIVPATPVVPLALSLQWHRYTSHYLIALATNDSGDAAACGVDYMANARAVEWDASGSQLWSRSMAVNGSAEGIWTSVTAGNGGPVLLTGEASVPAANGPPIVESVVAEYSISGALISRFVSTMASANQVPVGALSANGSRFAVTGQAAVNTPGALGVILTLVFNLP